MAWNFGGGRRVVFLGWRGTWRGSMAVETLPIRYRAASPGRIELNRVSGLIYEMARSYGPRSGEPPGYELISSREGGASPRIAEATTAGCGGDAIHGAGARSGTGIWAVDVADLASEGGGGGQVEAGSSAAVCALWSSHEVPRHAQGLLVGAFR